MGIKILTENSDGEIMDLYSYIKNLEKRIVHLESENIGTTNTLYEIENKIDTNDSLPLMMGEMFMMEDENDV